MLCLPTKSIPGMGGTRKVISTPERPHRESIILLSVTGKSPVQVLEDIVYSPSVMKFRIMNPMHMNRDKGRE